MIPVHSVFKWGTIIGEMRYQVHGEIKQGKIAGEMRDKLTVRLNQEIS